MWSVYIVLLLAVLLMIIFLLSVLAYIFWHLILTPHHRESFIRGWEEKRKKGAEE